MRARVITFTKLSMIISSLLTKMISFILNTIEDLLRRNRKPSPVLEAMLRTTHSSWVQSLQDTNRITDYEYKLWS